MIDIFFDILIAIINDEIKNTKLWIDDKANFYNIKKLSIDQRGRVGEHFFCDIFKRLNFNVEYINNGHGDYDLVVNNLKIEVKTATLDTNGKFQHEGIKSSKKWDYIVFLDIAPNEIYITFLSKSKFIFGLQKISNRGKTKGQMMTYGTVELNNIIHNTHFRGKDGTNHTATGAGYKVDFKLKDLKSIKTLRDFENYFNEVILN